MLRHEVAQGYLSANFVVSSSNAAGGARRCQRLPSRIAALISQDITGRVFDKLTEHFGRATVFRDIDDIRPGIDFRVQIAEALKTTNVLLVVVGPKWFGRTKGAKNRIDNEADPVRIEVETALRRDIPVIPVLVGGMKMPTAVQLPENLKDFAYRHAVAVDGGRDFDHHLQGLITVLEGILGPRTGLSETRIAAQHVPGTLPMPLSGPEPSREATIAQVATAGEPLPTPRVIPAWLRRYGLIAAGLMILILAISLVTWRQNISVPSVLARQTQAAFDKAKALDTVQGWDEFLTKVTAGDYQSGPLADQARQERAKFDLAAKRIADAGAKRRADDEAQQADQKAEEERKRAEQEVLWNAIRTAGAAVQLEEFVKKYPTSPHVFEARARLEEIRKAQERKKIEDQNKIAAVAPLVQPALPPTQSTQPSVGETGGVMPLSAERERVLKPKDSFKDCDKCPEMIVVPAGSFKMGSPESEPAHELYEGPEHTVTIAKPFAVGRFAVTFDEWDACAADGGCNAYKPVDQNWGRGRRPVIHVSWDDAKAYVAWLSRKSGKIYRLLSEAEREYITRAGTTTPFWWGSSISTSQANFDGTKTYGSGPTGDFRQQTVPVDKFQPNPWGLYQVHGNVWDYVEDCFHETYAGAPSDGSAWTFEDCGLRVIRGGSWQRDPLHLRSASRGASPSNNQTYYDVGLRVARTLTP